MKKTINQAHFVAPLDLSETISTRRDAFSELDGALSVVQRARQGFDELKTKIVDLERRADAIEKEIATAGGTEAAARALGLSTENSAPVDVEGLKTELRNIDAMLRETRAAVATAPGLFPPLLERLEAARAKASDAHRQVTEIAAAWAKAARETADRILADEKFVTDYIVFERLGVSLPFDFASLDQIELQNIQTERLAIETAKTESRPLVAEPPAPVAELGDWAARQSARNAEAERAWRAQRAAAEREAAEKRAKAESESARNAARARFA